MRMTKGYFSDLITWFLDDDIQYKLFRVWFKNEQDDTGCHFMYIAQIINLENGDYLIGLQHYDDTQKNCRYPQISYHLLSEIHFAYYEEDQEDDDANE